MSAISTGIPASNQPIPFSDEIRVQPVEFSESLFELVALTYDELLEIAGRHLPRKRCSCALEPTELVHEAYVRLNRTGPAKYQNKAHFFAVASRAMRQVLIDGARRAKAQKRGGAWRRVDLNQVDLACPETLANVLSLGQILHRLRELDPKLSRIVDLRLRELPFQEIAECLQMGQSTVRRDWAEARTWLQSQIVNPLP